MFERLRYGPRQYLLEVGTLQGMCAVVVDEIVQTVEHDVLDEKVLCLSAFLLRTNATVIHAWWVAPDQKKTRTVTTSIFHFLSLSL